MAHIFQDENPIVCMDNATGKPSNHYWLNGVHFAEQFPRNWAYSQLPNTGSECRTCMTDASWCGVIIGYCRQCAKLYRECGDDRGPGFTAFGTEYDETDPASAHITYMADVEWRNVGKHELLEQQLRQYYYKHVNAELSKKLDKSKRKVWCKRDALGGETRMRLAQMEKQIQIRQKAQKKQMKRSVKIELLIHSNLRENEVERLNGYKTDIKIIDNSVKIIEADIGSCHSHPSLWDGHTLTRLGQEKIQEMMQKIRKLHHQKRKIEENVNRDELDRIDAFIGCLRKGDLLSQNLLFPMHCINSSLIPDISVDWALRPSSAYYDFIDRNELNIEELTRESNLLRWELDLEDRKDEEEYSWYKPADEYGYKSPKYVEWCWNIDWNTGVQKKKRFAYPYSQESKTEQDRSGERLARWGMEPSSWKALNIQKTPIDDWDSDDDEAAESSDNDISEYTD